MIKKLINDSGNIVVFDYAIANSNGYEICYVADLIFSNLEFYMWQLLSGHQKMHWT